VAVPYRRRHMNHVGRDGRLDRRAALDMSVELHDASPIKASPWTVITSASASLSPKVWGPCMQPFIW
jgi:hypothetical protein